jgi:4-amino-4-deoxy-L-arabinose transferase-like glycosyltransferase
MTRDAAQVGSALRPEWVLAGVCLLLLVAGTWALPLLDRDEPRFAHATVEMMQRGDWIVPWFNDEYRFDKPPLTYWMMAVGYATFGVNEFGARVHSILAALGATLALFAFGQRLLSTRTALAAAFAWATCLQVFLHGRLALADMPMVLAVLIAHWALWELLFGEERAGFGRWHWTLWLALALGFLAKGPIAVITPALTLVFLRLFLGRRGLPWRRLEAAIGVPIMLAVIGAWGIPALIRTGGAFWDVGIGEHVVRRGVVAFNDRPVVPFYYLVTIFLSLFPWSPNLGQVIVELRRNWRDDKNKFLFAWALGPFLVFSFYTTQLPHYTMPAYPALLLLMFRSGADPTSFPRASRVFYWGLHGLLAAILAAVLGWALLAPVSGEVADLGRPIAALTGALLALQAAALAWARSAHRERGSSINRVPAASLMAVGTAAVCTVAFAATVRPLSAPIRLRDIFDRMPPETTRIARGYTEPSLVFYADGFWTLDGDPPGSDLLEGSAPLLILYRVGETGLDRIFRPGGGSAPSRTTEQAAEQAAVPRFLVESDLQRTVVRGFNFARSTWTEMLVFYRP